MPESGLVFLSMLHVYVVVRYVTWHMLYSFLHIQRVWYVIQKTRLIEESSTFKKILEFFLKKESENKSSAANKEAKKTHIFITYKCVH